MTSGDRQSSDSVTGVSISRQPLVIQMSPLAAPDPNPPLPSIGYRSVFPYHRITRFGSTPVDRTVTELALENRHLRVGVIPELGGRVWHTHNRHTGQPLFHTPDRIGLVNFGLRGAWYTGGVEFNFPNSHTVVGMEAIPAAIRQHEDGGGSVLVGEIDRAARVGWTVGVRLQPDSSSIHFDILLYNRTSLPVRYWWWINAGVPAGESLEYVNATGEVVPHYIGGHGAPVSWPIDQGRDLRWYRNYVEPTSLFHLAGDDRWFGFYEHQRDQGVVRVGASADAPGLKIWHSGLADEGRLWGSLMTAGEDYANSELQSGRPETQTDFAILPPQHVLRWSEQWRPVWGLGGVACASESLAINLLPTADKSSLRLLADRPLRGVTIHAIGESEQRVTLDLPADRPIDVPLTFAADSEPLTIEAFAADGSTLLSFHRPADRMRRSVLADVLQVRPEPDPLPETLSVEELTLHADRYERANLPAAARAMAEQALARDPGNTAAHLLLAVRDLRDGRYADAREHCRTILRRNPRHEWAHYYLALSHLWDGNQHQAEIEFERAAGQGYANSAAVWLHLGELRMRHRDWRGTIHTLDRCLIHEGNHVKARALRAAALRHAGRATESRAALATAIDLAPLDPLVRAEQQVSELPPTDESIEVRAADRQVEDALEAACDYLAGGLIDDARRVLERSPIDAAQHPIARYYLGYVDLLDGDREAALAHWSAAARYHNAYAVSFRHEDAVVLAAVLAHEPNDALAHALLGMLETSRSNPHHALPALERAAELRPDWSQPHRLMAIGCRLLNQPDRAIEHLQHAVAIDAENATLYVELDDLLAEHPDRSIDRQRLWNAAPESVLDDDRARGRYADALLAAGQPARAAQLLIEHTFFPDEGSDAYRDLWVQAHLLLALSAAEHDEPETALEHAARAATYPPTLGLGAPHIRYDAPALLLQAAIHARRSDRAAARTLLRSAAAEQHRTINEAEFCSALAQQALGRNDTARAVFHRLLAESRRIEAWPDGDPQLATFLRALGDAGLHDAPLPPPRAARSFPRFRRKAAICGRIAWLIRSIDGGASST